MKLCRLWLALPLMAWIAATVLAAPAPAPESQGPISDALRLRDKLPKTAPPTSHRVVLRDDNIVEVERVRYNYAYEVVTRKVQRDGNEIEVAQYVARAIPVVYREQIAVKSCTFYTVTKEGKLEAVETKKAAAQLKKLTLVLTGDSAEVDPRHLEVVKPGTLYVVLPAAATPYSVPAAAPGSIEKEPLEKKDSPKE
jgi:hypothetical protein